MEICEAIRHQRGMKKRYQKCKETIERLFGTAKEYHNLRYTREKGKSKMEDKLGLTLACLNLKKLVKMMAGRPFYFALSGLIYKIFPIRTHFSRNKKKTNLKNEVYLLSETNLEDQIRFLGSIISAMGNKEPSSLFLFSLKTRFKAFLIIKRINDI